MEKINLAQKFDLIDEHWSPKVVGEVNDVSIKLVKFQGDFIWHHHETEDELFFVVKGTMVMKLRDGDISVGENEFIIIPRGVEHMPMADEEVFVMLIEPTTTLNTGNIESERTVKEPERL
ncbi:MAG: cupin domain-containing protein [Candidatus Aminicenantes bacterium]|jgi:mannose-6-phosphate isomerase-like protein (cupin superfamily)